jgi:hypothetical protein
MYLSKFVLAVVSIATRMSHVHGAVAGSVLRGAPGSEGLPCGSGLSYYNQSKETAAPHVKRRFWKRSVESQIDIRVGVVVVKGGGPDVRTFHPGFGPYWIQMLNRAYSQFGFNFTLANYREVDSVQHSSNYNARTDPLGVLQTKDRKFLNIVVAEQVLSDGQTVRGTATFPWDFDRNALQGIYVRANAMPPFQLSTLPHEVGHWLGLLHTFQNGCPQASADTVQFSHHSDFVRDTEVAQQYKGVPTESGTCPAPSIPENSHCFLDGKTDPEPYPYYNYMSYSAPQCRYHFTQGQGNRMRAMWAWREFLNGPDQETLF